MDLGRWASFLGIMAALIGAGAASVRGERNPFTLPPGIQKKEPVVGGERTPARGKAWEGEKDFRVSTILVGPRTKVASINGILVREGEEVEGYRVIGILPTQVILGRGKEKRIVKLDRDPGLGFKKTHSDQRVLGQDQ